MTIHKINVRFYKLIGIIWNGNGFFLVMVWWLKNYMTQYYSMCICALWLLRLHSFNLHVDNSMKCNLVLTFNNKHHVHVSLSPSVFASIVQSCSWHGVSHSIFKCFRQKWWSCESHTYARLWNGASIVLLFY